MLELGSGSLQLPPSGACKEQEPSPRGLPNGPEGKVPRGSQQISLVCSQAAARDKLKEKWWGFCFLIKIHLIFPLF